MSELTTRINVAGTRYDTAEQLLKTQGALQAEWFVSQPKPANRLWTAPPKRSSAFRAGNK